MEEIGGFAVSVIIVLLGTVSFAVWLFSLIHCVRNKRLSDTNRLVGVLLIIFLFLAGSFVYLFLPREQPVPSHSPHA